MNTKKEIGFLLYRIAKLTLKDLLSIEEHSGLSLPQLHTLFLIKQGCTTMSTLADELQIKLPSATGIIDRLVKHKYVERTADPHDRRLVRLALTKAGNTALHKDFKAKQAHLKIFFNNLSAEDLTTIRSILERVAENITQAKSHN